LSRFNLQFSICWGFQNNRTGGISAFHKQIVQFYDIKATVTFVFLKSVTLVNSKLNANAQYKELVFVV